jgi:predicted dienelactone hydrolase
MFARCLSAAAIAVTLFSPAHLQAAQPELPGYDRMDVPARHRAEPLAVSIWYPAGRATYRVTVGENAIFSGEPALLGAAVASGRHPLIVLSHGSGGAMDGLAWLSSRLARRGALVVGVNHPGTTSGDSSPRRTPWLAPRAADLAAALDAVLSDPQLAESVDRERISALGFSLGGSTVLGVAGLRFDAEAFASYCEEAGTSSQDCAFFEKGGVDLRQLPESFSADMFDARFSRIVAVDPGFTHAVQPESPNRIRADMLFLSLGARHLWPAVDVSEKGSGLAGQVAKARHITVSPAHHFTFLALCREGAAEKLRAWGDDPVCDDPQGSDRAKAHEEIAEAVASFLELGPAGEQ